MPGKFKPGDLVVLNQYGVFITYDHEDEVGIIVSGPYSLLYDNDVMAEPFYTVYDVLLDGQLFTLVPEEFMEFYKEYEEDDE